MINKQFNIFIAILTIVCITCIICVKIYNRKEQNIKETLAMPVTNKIIILDAGHGLPDDRGDWI